jgi:hypothetical protein
LPVTGKTAPILIVSASAARLAEEGPEKAQSAASRSGAEADVGFDGMDLVSS